MNIIKNDQPGRHILHFLSSLALLLLLYFIPRPVTAAEPAEFDGVIEPNVIIDVGSPVEGVVESINAERSGLVKKDQPLVKLESSVEKAAVERALAQVKLEGEIKLQREKLAFADRTHKRINDLFQSEAVSASKKDEASTELALARCNLQKARENKKLAEKELKRAKAILDLRTIHSPISGVVVERFVSRGELVSSQPLLKLAQIDPLRVEVILPASLFGTIKPGMKADIIPELSSTGKHTAIVNLVDRVIDSASGTFGASLELPNPDYALPSGLKCTVRFEIKEQQRDQAAIAQYNKPLF